MNGNEKIDRKTTFTVKNNTKLEVHFNQTFTNLTSFLDASIDGRLESLISVYFCHFDTSSVTNMASMFYQCSSLQYLNLSNFDTSSVTDMHEMFFQCTSLKYLIISNFDFTTTDNTDYIFDEVNNLEYIDIYNIKGSQKIQSKLNELSKANLIVCQNNTIITEVINNCSKNIDDNDDILVCNNIQTTIPLIQTTIPQIQTTIPIIQTTIPLIQTTIPIIQTTLPQIQTNIPIIQTTIPEINIPEIINEQTSLTLLGFNHFKLSSSSISFNILFTQILNEIYSKSMKAPLIIIYNENIRILEEKEIEIECYLKEKKKTNIVSYFYRN